MYKLKRISFALLLVWTLQALDLTLQQECSGGDVRLLDGSSSLEGRVEVCIGERWGTVCDDDWDGRDAAVVCKQLGYPSVFSTASKFGRFGMVGRGDDQPIHLDEVRCTGSEDRLVDCFHNTTEGTDCTHSEDAGVICEGDTCTTGAVRLVGGTDAKEGRVEICFGDTWSPVCRDGWDDRDAAVVCRQLGLLPDDAVAVAFGPGLGPVALENVSCDGSEPNLWACPSDRSEGNSSQCLQHAGAVCEPPCILDGLTECGLSPSTGSGINSVEVCFCSADCVNFGDCCRDLRLLANCSIGEPVCNDTDVRLVDGTREWNGRLEVCINGQWGSVCERHFEEIDAQVVCRELGYPEENALALPGGTFGQIDLTWLAGVECLGTESSILECQSMGVGNFIPCKFGNASGVWCAGAAPAPECNESAIRLANGTSAANGRVEVCYRGVWGAVCSDGWDERDAAVVCRELGQETSHPVAILELTFGSGTGPIVLDDVECQGQESRLGECSHPGIGVHNCFRVQEASVSCRGGPVTRCTSNPPEVTEEQLNRFGVCVPYSGSSSICNRVFTGRVDYVYVPYSRGQVDLALDQLERVIGSMISLASDTCQNLFSRFLCNSFIFGCGSETSFSSPMSVCPEECNLVQRECPELWAALGSSLLRGFDFTNCSTVGRVLEPLPHCCTDAGIGGSDRPIAAIVGGAVGGGVGLLLLLLALCVIPVVIYFMHTKIKIRKLKQSLDLSYGPQDSVTELIRVASLSSRGGTITSYPGEEACKGDEEEFRIQRAFSLRYTPNPAAPDAMMPPLQVAQLVPPRPPSPVTSQYLRQLTSHMLIPSSQIRLLDSIGQGEFGLVYKAHFLKSYQEAMRSNVNPKIVAVKTLKGSFNEDTIHKVLEESVKMKSFDHPNVLSLIGVCVDAGPAPYIVMPYMSNGCLLTYLKKERRSLILSEGAEEEQMLDAQKRMLNMCIQIASGMEYLATKKFIHRDLATRNCMIDSQFIIKVSDFGLSEDIYAKNYFRQGKESSVKLPVKWMAPESLNDGIFTEKSDVWSYAITCWEVFSAGKSPYPGMDPSSIIRMLETGGRLDKPLNAACSDSMYELMNQCWHHDPEERPTFSELVHLVTNILEPIAGYLDLKTITGIVANTQADDRHRNHTIDSPTSLDTPTLAHDVTTAVGITIHLDRWSDSIDSGKKDEGSVQKPTTKSSGVPQETKTDKSRNDGVPNGEKHMSKRLITDV